MFKDLVMVSFKRNTDSPCRGAHWHFAQCFRFAVMCFMVKKANKILIHKIIPQLLRYNK